MTAIAAMHVPSFGTWFASDRQSSGTLTHPVSRKTGKWVVSGRYAVAVAGHLRTLNLIEHNAEALVGRMRDPMGFVDDIRELLTENGYAFSYGRDEDGAPCGSDEFLIASPDGLWKVASDFCVLDHCGTFAAIGSGEHLCLGAMHALKRNVPAMPASQMVIEGITAAIAHDVYSSGEIAHGSLIY